MKKDFPIFKRKIDGKPIIYLDNAATSQKPIQVINAVTNFYKNYNANVHRGQYKLSMEATDLFEKSRRKVAKFINAEENEIVFTKNATESLNLVANSLNLKKDDEILITEMEHHSNLVVWQKLAKRKKLKLKYVKLKNKELDLVDLRKKLTRKTRVVSIVHASNVLATINPIKEIRRMIGHRIFIVDGSQAVSHVKVDVKELGCDFYAFSSHKMLGPSGVGVLYGRYKLLKKMRPFLFGGDMVADVSFKEAQFNEPPSKFEAGTQNMEGVIGLGAAIDYIEKVGLENMSKREQELKKYTLKKLKQLPQVKILSNEKGVPLITFNIRTNTLVHGHDVSYILSQENVFVRSGYLCAQPLIEEKLKQPGVVRVSLHFYNDKKDIMALISGLKKIIKGFS